KDDKLYGGDSRDYAGAGNIYQLETGTSDPVLLNKVIDDCETTWTGSADNTSEYKEGSTSQKITSTDFSDYASLTAVDTSLTFKPRSRNIVERSDSKSVAAFVDTSGDVQVHIRDTDGTLDTNLNSPHGATFDDYDQKYPDIALLSNNDIVIVWDGKKTGDTYKGVYFSKYTSGAWTTPVLVYTTSAWDNYLELAPSIAVQDDNTYWVAMAVQPNTTPSIQQQWIYTSKTTDGGDTWGGAQQLYAGQGTGGEIAPYGFPELICDNNNYIHLISSGKWLMTTPSLVYRRWTGSSWESPQQLVTNPFDFSMAVEKDNYVNIAYIGSDNKTYWKVSLDSGANFNSAIEFNASSGKTWQRIGLAFGSSKTDDGYARNDWQLVA
ncbi:hypothetical protein LCGC14_2938220, partial [marine sediment metagenome]